MLSLLALMCFPVFIWNPLSPWADYCYFYFYLPSKGSAARAALAGSAGENLGVMKSTKDGNVTKEA